jgi:FKBP-type peptidyl-prolyl cis-trans isomerase FklB
MKSLLILLLSGILLIPAVAQEKPKKSKKNKEKTETVQPAVQSNVLSNQLDSISYGLGIVLGTTIKNAGITAIRDEMFVKAIDDAIQGNKPLLSIDDANVFLDSYVEHLGEIKARENLKMGEKFLTENAKRDSVVTMQNGLQYKIIRDGQGNSPVDTSIVTVHYTGRMIDGTIFDSSVERGEPAQFPVNRVIPGWTQALKLMKPGAKWVLYLHPSLAYGDKVMRTIPPNSVLIFDVELLSVDNQ